VANERRALQSALSKLERTLHETQQVLEGAGATYGTFGARVAAKVPVAEAFSDMAMPWADVTVQLAELERARHRVRTAVFALGLAEGMTIAELGRLYGFSKQLAARVAAEVRNPTS
jgi:hypothetical protein